MYTREQVLGMVAGRELDALVAERVMGFSGIRFGRNDPSAVWIEHPERRKFQPSTDIATAWEVVEKIDGDVTVKRYATIGNGHRYWCKIQKAISTHEYAEYLGTGDTAPLAICRAALLSLLKED